MPINKLERVIWRLRDLKANKITLSMFKRAIIMEIGYSEQTYYRVKRSLVTLGYITCHKTQIKLTNKDLT